MDIEWNYAVCCCHISMPGFISMLLLKFKHPHPAKSWLSPYKCLPNGAKSHITLDLDSLKLLNASRKHCAQEIVGLLLNYARAVDNKLLVALSTIDARQAKATVATEQVVDLLLNHVATYPNDGIVY